MWKLAHGSPHILMRENYILLSVHRDIFWHFVSKEQKGKSECWVTDIPFAILLRYLTPPVGARSMQFFSNLVQMLQLSIDISSSPRNPLSFRELICCFCLFCSCYRLISTPLDLLLGFLISNCSFFYCHFMSFNFISLLVHSHRSLTGDSQINLYEWHFKSEMLRLTASVSRKAMELWKFCVWFLFSGFKCFVFWCSFEISVCIVVALYAEKLE